jgi:acetate---CoA ligase (ADP-forming)
MSLDALFRPRSVAVVGASRNPGSLGNGIVQNLVQGGFPGPIYPVNPRPGEVLGLPSFPSLDAIPGPVDLAVMTIPSRYILDATRDAAAAGVKAIVMVTAGFKETGGEGVARETELLRIIREAGIRMVGPNCMGLLDTWVDAPLNASFAAVVPRPGRVAFASQSGALGEVILEIADDLDLGVASFVSLGNQSDVDASDLLEHWAEDERAQLILLYMESIARPARFARLARRIVCELGKPILAVKAGRSEAGARAASSHTGSLAGADAAASALLEQAGVIQVDTLGDLFTLAPGFAHQPCPAGRRIAILTNAGGPGILATDAADRYGLVLPELALETVAAMAGQVLPESSLSNPVDILAPATPEHYRVCTEALLADPSVHGLIVIHVSPVTTDGTAVAQGVLAAIRRADVPDKPVLTSFMNVHRGAEARDLLRQAGVPSYRLPEAAARTMAAMARHGERRSEADRTPPSLDPPPDAAAAQAIVEAAIARGGGDGQWLDFAEAMALLEATGIPVAAWRAVERVDEVEAFALEHGWPVVLKVDHPALLHKTEHGGVRPGLRTAGEAGAALSELRALLTASGGGGSVVVQPMLSGVETLAGISADASYGHLLAFGLGGVHVEVLKDVVFRVCPLTGPDASSAVRGIRGLSLLQGARGAEPADLSAIEHVLLRLSALVEAAPGIVELDLNPLFASADGAVAVDARVRVSREG